MTGQGAVSPIPGRNTIKGKKLPQFLMVLRTGCSGIQSLVRKREFIHFSNILEELVFPAETSGILATWVTLYDNSPSLDVHCSC